MTRIRGGQKRKGNTQQEDAADDPLPSPTASINPSTESGYVDTTCVDATSRQAADPMIIEDATVPLHPVEVISSIPVIDPNTATNQQGRMMEDIQAVSRRLTALDSQYKELKSQVQELEESNKRLTESAAQKDADLLSLRSENEALKLATASRAKPTNIDITLLPHYKELYNPKAEEIYKKLLSDLDIGEDDVKMYLRDGQTKDYLAEAKQAKKDLEDMIKDLEAKMQAAVRRYKDQVIKLIIPLAIQYEYTLAVDECRAQAPSFDFTVLPSYKEMYNPKAGEIYKKLMSELANGKDIVNKYL